MILKQSATNQLHFQPGIDLREYELLTFSFYQNGKCVAKYLSTDTDYVKLNPDYSVDIYMVASVAKKFGPQRVSFEICTWDGDRFELLVSETMDVEICRSNERTSIVDSDDSEITDSRIRAEIERIAAKYIPKNVSDKVDELDDKVAELDENLDEAIENWYEEHPEATTRIADGAITWNKLNDNVRLASFKSGSNGPLARFAFWYVDGVDGDDENNGRSESTPFKTLERAFDEARKGDLEFRVCLKAGQTYSITATSFTSLSIHFSAYGTGDVTLDLQNAGTRIAFYQCHLNVLGTESNEFIFTGEDFYFDAGAVQLAYTTVESSLMSYGASLRTQNSSFAGLVTLYNCGAMFENCDVHNIVAVSSNVYLNACHYYSTTLIPETDRLLQFNNCFTSFVGSGNVIDLSSNDSAISFIFAKVFGGQLYWRGEFAIVGEGNTILSGISANSAEILGHPDYLAWLNNNAGIELLHNSTVPFRLKRIYNGTAGLGTFTLTETLKQGHKYMVRAIINTGDPVVEYFVVPSSASRFFIRQIYGSSSANIKVIELAIAPNSNTFSINTNRLFYFPTTGTPSVTTYTQETAVSNNCYIDAIYEVQ